MLPHEFAGHHATRSHGPHCMGRKDAMSNRPIFSTKTTVMGLVSFLLSLAIVQVGTLSAAQVVEADPVCSRGTDTIKRIEVWYVQEGTAGTLRWYRRPYLVHLPPAYNGTVPFPVVIVLHGGGGNKEAARKMTCPNGNLDDPRCLDRVTDCEGFITVYPDGTSGMTFENVRTFNAGGGYDGYECVSGPACGSKVDEFRYFSDLLDTLEREYTIDPARIYVTGHSNGGALTHRLACELSHRIAAIAPVASGNQFSAIDHCSPLRSIPVLEIHGTEDRCWPYQGGPQTCGGRQSSASYFPIPDTVAGWASRNGCRPSPIVENLPDNDPADGTTVTRMSYQGCSNGGDVQHLRINGGGHTWPGGSAALHPWIVGRISRDLHANKVIWEFFKAHPMPSRD